MAMMGFPLPSPSPTRIEKCPAGIIQEARQHRGAEVRSRFGSDLDRCTQGTLGYGAIDCVRRAKMETAVRKRGIATMTSAGLRGSFTSPGS